MQNSVFECIVDSTQFAELKIDLQKVIGNKTGQQVFDQLKQLEKGKNEHE